MSAVAEVLEVPGVPGMEITQFELQREHIIDQSMILVGPTKSGKSVIIRDVLYKVRESFNNAICFAPTEGSNGLYGKLFHPLCVHTQLGYPRTFLTKSGKEKKEDGADAFERFLEEIWERQELRMENYNAAHSLEILPEVFAMIPAKQRRGGVQLLADIDKMERATHRLLAGRCADPDELKVKIEAVEEQFEESRRSIYRDYIRRYRRQLGKRLKAQGSRADPTHLVAVTYLDFNPRTLLVFDDCAAELKPLFKREIFRKIFYQGRHQRITIIISAQSATDVPSEARQQSFVTFYTKPAAAVKSFGLASDGHDKAVMRNISKISDIVFDAKGGHRHRKLVWYRVGDGRYNLHHFTAAMRPSFSIQPPEVRAYLEKCEASRKEIGRGNKFADRMNGRLGK
jgi:hypothetical protein